MLSLAQAVLGQSYQVTGFHPSLMQDNHLRNMGVVMGSVVRLVSTQPDGSSLISIHHTKIAITQEILSKILVTEDTEIPRLSLSELKPGQEAVVAAILGTGAVKRRLLDMGITKGTTLLLRKMAPLGDPIEIHLRGYELTLRKKEAELVMVYLEETK